MNSFGQIFKVNIFGASHEDCCGVMLEGIRAGIPLKEEDFLEALQRRKPQAYGTPRKESDYPNIISGVYNGYTNGNPLVVIFQNSNTRPSDYNKLIEHPRPSHADFAAYRKYQGFNDIRGGGAFSGRLTLGLVVAGVVAKKIYNVDVKSEIVKLGKEEDKTKFKDLLEDVKNNLDSIGGVIKITIPNLEIGLGEPYFDSLESLFSHALFSVGAVKGVSFGSGFSGCSLRGSEYNDLIIDETGKTATNNNGGINGGLSNGNDVIINVAVKPTPSIGKAQMTYNFKDKKVEPLEIGGRHDIAIILRMGVILESVCQIVLTDLYLRKKALECA